MQSINVVRLNRSSDFATTSAIKVTLSTRVLPLGAIAATEDTICGPLALAVA
jgi:hypothetical protein